jgi:dTDP-glucose 4,6-dehydratase
VKIIETAIPGVKIIEPRVFGDDRGFFMESWSRRTFADAGLTLDFVQDNHSRSRRGVLRGLHYQLGRPQAKLVRATRHRRRRLHRRQLRPLMLETGLPIVNLDKLTYAGNLDTLASVMDHPRHHFVQGDIGDRSELIARLLREHRSTPWSTSPPRATSTAPSTAPPPSSRPTSSAPSTCSTAPAPTGAGLAEPKAAFRFLHVSTDEVYGSLGATGAFTETTPYAPNSPYSASKAASDHLVRAWHHTYGLPVLTTNCSNNYGPYQFPEKLIPLMIAKARAGEPLPIYGDGSNVRDWLYVEDHCRAIARVLEAGRPGEVYNVGGNSEKTNLEVVDTLCALLDEALPDSPHRPHASSSSSSPTARSRPALRHRRQQAQARTGLGAAARPSRAACARTLHWYLDKCFSSTDRTRWRCTPVPRPWISRTSGMPASRACSR